MSNPQSRLAPFAQQVKIALEHYHDPAWLSLHSPLAQPYFLGEIVTTAYPGVATADCGLLLVQELWTSVLTLWGSAPPADREEIQCALRQHDEYGLRYSFWLLALNYFQVYLPPGFKSPLSQATIYNEILHISRATYDRHLHLAIQQLADRLLARMQPAIRLEQPFLRRPLVGREQLHQQILTALLERQTVSLSGIGGIGKSTLGTAILASWSSSATFLFTTRPTLNDRLHSLLFALGYFLHKQGSSTLWQQLIAERNKTQDWSLLLGLLRYDLAHLPTAPLLCFDEVDLLHRTDSDQQHSEHTQILEFLNALRGYTPLLLIGQRPVIDSDAHYILPPLTIAETAQLLLEQSNIPYTYPEIVRLYAFTNGNPRLLELCLALYTPDTTISAIIDALPQTPAITPVFDRLWRRLKVEERQVLQFLSVFRSPVPSIGFQHSQQIVQDLFQHNLVQKDRHNGIALLPVLRNYVYNNLSAETRARLLIMAAQLRASLGEYTAAAYHYHSVGELEKAIEILYPNLEQEIRRGQGLVALQILQQISIQHVSRSAGRLLALARARLYRLTGEAEPALESLRAVDWPVHDPLTADALYQQGFFLQHVGDIDGALVKFDEGINQISALLSKRAAMMVQRARIYERKRDMEKASKEAQRVKFEAERLQGIIQDELGNPTQAHVYFWSALAVAETLQDENRIADIYIDLGMIETRQAKGETAFDYFEKALYYYQKLNNHYKVAVTRANIAYLCVEIGAYDKAIQIAQDTLEYFHAIGNVEGIAVLCVSLADVSFQLGNLADAKKYAEQILVQEERQHIPSGLYTLGDIQHAQDNLQEAENFYRQALQLAEENEDSVMLAYIFQHLGNVCNQQGKVEEGRQCLHQALRLFQRLEIQKKVRETTEYLAKMEITQLPVTQNF